MVESENPIRARLKAACTEYENAAVKPTINKLARQFELHPQILTGALMAYEAIPDPKSRGPKTKAAWRVTAAAEPETQPAGED